MGFQNGSNKVVIELRVVQFSSEIILVVSNHVYDLRPNCTPLSAITIINYISTREISYQVSFRAKTSYLHTCEEITGYIRPLKIFK